MVALLVPAVFPQIVGWRMRHLHNFGCIAHGTIDAILFDPVEDFLSSILKTELSATGKALRSGPDATMGSARSHATEPPVFRVLPVSN
jgi:hypothetical protein